MDEREPIIRWVSFAVAIVLAVLLAIRMTTPPGPVGADADPDAFSAERAMTHIEVIAARPHVTGSEANAAVRRYLVAELEELGLDVRTRAVPIDGAAAERVAFFSDQPSLEQNPPSAVNVIGVLPGRDREAPAIALMAHYDSVKDSPGAPDDAAGVATILETLRAIRAAGGPDRDVIALLTDGEELGLVGARGFFADDPLRDRVGIVVNLEARGGGGRTTLFQTASENGEAVRLFADAVDRPGGSSLATYIYERLPNNSDLTPALQAGYQGYNLAFIGRPRLYHSPLATPGRLDPGALQDMGSQVLDLTRGLMAADALPDGGSPVTFFDAFGLATIVLPAWAGWPLLLIGVAGYVVALKGDWRFDGMLEGAGRMVVYSLTVGLVLYVLNLLSGADGPVNYYDRLAAIPQIEAIAAAVALFAFLALLAQKTHDRDELFGAMLPLLLMAIAAQAAAPVAAYVLVMPLALGGIVAAIAARSVGWAGNLAAALIAAVPAGYLIGMGHQLMQAIGPDLPMIAAVPAAYGVLVLLPLWPSLRTTAAQLLSLLPLLVAVVLAFTVRTDPLAPSVATYSEFR